jgi:tetratricopeptide (TPR) repeat protein
LGGYYALGGTSTAQVPKIHNSLTCNLNRVPTPIKSFDVFDTLITRRCVDPRQQQYMLEARAGIRGLAVARMAADERLGGRGQPYSLCDIWREVERTMSLDAATVDRLHKMEMEIEYQEVIDIETVVTHVRLFRHHPGLLWKYRVHEQILPSLRQTNAKIHFSDVEIQHVGYHDPALHSQKLERNLRLLNLELAEQPDEPFLLFNLGAAYQELERPADALPILRRSLQLSHVDDSIVRKLYAMLANCHRKLDQPTEAIEVCQTGRQHYPDDPELLFQEGLARDRAGDWSGAESAYRRLVDGGENGDYFRSVADGLRGHLGRHNLALLLLKLKRFAEAEAQWRLALMAEPDFLPAKVGLGELYLDRQNFTALEQMAEQFSGHPEAAILRARAKMARKQFAAARWELTQALDRYPNDLRLRLIFSHALLQEGKDPIGAEQALRAVLQLDADHGEAKHNLEVLLRERAA